MSDTPNAGDIPEMPQIPERPEGTDAAGVGPAGSAGAEPRPGWARGLRRALVPASTVLEVMSPMATRATKPGSAVIDWLLMLS